MPNSQFLFEGAEPFHGPLLGRAIELQDRFTLCSQNYAFTKSFLYFAHRFLKLRFPDSVCPGFAGLAARFDRCDFKPHVESHVDDW